MCYNRVGIFRYFDENGTQRDDIGWWDKLADRMKGRIEDLLEPVEPGTDGLKDHFMANYLECLERTVGT